MANPLCGSNRTYPSTDRAREKPSQTQARVLALMREGHRLMWFGDNGPEMEGFPFWPQKSTVRAMLSKGLLEWGEPLNETQRKAGICPLVMPIQEEVP